MTHNVFYKKPRLKDEYETRMDPRLRIVNDEVAEWVYLKFNKPWTITCIMRTPAENEAVGGKEKTAHYIDISGYVRADDCRSRNFTKSEKVLIVEYVNATWNRFIEYVHIVWHNSGHGEHFHININYGK